MKLTLYHGHVIDMLKRIPDDSVDMIVTSPPYFGARDYSTVKTAISTKSEEDCIKLATSYIEMYRTKYPNDKFYYSPVKHYNAGFNPIDKQEIPERWQIDVHIDVRAIWGGDPECKHEFRYVITRLQHENRNGRSSSQMKESKANNANIPMASEICDKCGAWRGNLGNEPSVQSYVSHLLMVIAELRRVLKPSGFMMWNIADTYGGDMGKTQGYSDSISDAHLPTMHRSGRQKSLLLVPQRILIGMDEQGWFIRNNIIWTKSNHKPESVLDRYSASHEYVFFLTKSRRYYWNLDAVREPYAESTYKRISQSTLMTQQGGDKQRDLRGVKASNGDNGSRDMDMVKSLAIKIGRRMPQQEDTTQTSLYGNRILSKYQTSYGQDQESFTRTGPILDRMAMNHSAGNVGVQEEYISDDGTVHRGGKNPGDVWRINTAQYRGEHTAVFPVALALKSLLPGPRQVCGVCGSPAKLTSYNPGISSEDVPKSWGATNNGYDGADLKNYSGTGAETPGQVKARIIRNAQMPKYKVLWQGCSHNTFTEATVLDPFLGAGTTFITAKSLGVNAIGIEINGIYVEQIKKRVGWGISPDIHYDVIEG